MSDWGHSDSSLSHASLPCLAMKIVASEEPWPACRHDHSHVICGVAFHAMEIPCSRQHARVADSVCIQGSFPRKQHMLGAMHVPKLVCAKLTTAGPFHTASVNRVTKHVARLPLPVSVHRARLLQQAIAPHRTLPQGSNRNGHMHGRNIRCWRPSRDSMRESC